MDCIEVTENRLYTLNMFPVLLQVLDNALREVHLVVVDVLSCQSSVSLVQVVLDVTCSLLYSLLFF